MTNQPVTEDEPAKNDNDIDYRLAKFSQDMLRIFLVSLFGKFKVYTQKT